MADQRRALESYLVASARLGDQSAMHKLVNVRGPRLLAHAARLLQDSEEARDVVQDAWVEILRGLGGLREIEAFPAWATRIVTRRCARLIRSKQRQRSLARSVAQEAEPNAEPDGEDAAEAAMVRKAITQLSPDHSATIALFYLEDMSVAEIAMALTIPPGTVKTRLMHARAKLKAALKGDDDDR